MVCAAGLFFGGLLSSQETGPETASSPASVDDLFTGGQDIVVPVQNEEEAPDHTADFTTGPKLRFSGSITATGGVAIGYTQWPDFQDPLNYYDGSAGATATTTLVMNAQPSQVLSVYGDISTSLGTEPSDDSDLDLSWLSQRDSMEWLPLP